MGNVVDVYQITTRMLRSSNELSENKSKISKYQEEYNSLVQFETSVSNSHQQIILENNSKKLSLEVVRAGSNHNKIADKYSEGMSSMLEDFNSNIFWRFFTGIHENISNELNRLDEKIKGLEDRNTNLNEMIGDYQKKLRAVKLNIE